MKSRIFLPTALLSMSLLALNPLWGQTNMFVSNPIAEQVLLGDYDPGAYAASSIIDQKEVILESLAREISRERLVDLLEFLDTFYNRNTGSDTLSLDTGIGACRTWIKSYFDLISRENENRLITGYLEFDAQVCGMGHHKNPFALLPGRDTSLHEILVIEGHFDTRNQDGCDTQGYTPGSDDNGSGTVLVMEAARVLSQFSFDRTILFTTPTGEDQGLWGAKAWANYLSQKEIEVMACLNNDVVGGIFCGKTSSPPSCPYYGHIDSTSVRVFSYVAGNSTYTNSPHKQLARLIKIIQEEEVNPYLATPMTIRIMSSEDRSGRSGDHIPFRQKGYPAIRFCSSNEHGNGSGTAPDRQHSTRDVLGIDSDADGKWDSLYVDPGYLSRNTLINAATLANLANSAPAQEVSFYPVPRGVRVQISQPDPSTTGYRVGIRYRQNRSHEFDEVRFYDPDESFEVEVEPSSRCFVSIALIKNGFTGRFSDEYELNLSGLGYYFESQSPGISEIYPNPVETALSIVMDYPEADRGKPVLSITDVMGRQVLKESVIPAAGSAPVSLDVQKLNPGVYWVNLISGGIPTKTHRFLKLGSK